MRVIVGMETSGAVRQLLRSRGVDAWSVDLLPSEDDSPYHIQGDVFEVLYRDRDWTWGLFHPDCTYLTNSAAWAFKDGPYHQRVKPGTLVGAERREAREQAIAQVKQLMALPFPHAIENPIGAISTRIRRPDQIIQPYQFGDDASKATCLWLKQLPKLVPTCYIEPRIVNGKSRWANQTDSGQNRLSPSKDRWRERSRTYPGIADAIVTQWMAAFQ
jgi:hypothetical protein